MVSFFDAALHEYGICLSMAFRLTTWVAFQRHFGLDKHPLIFALSILILIGLFARLNFPAMSEYIMILLTNKEIWTCFVADVIIFLISYGIIPRLLNKSIGLESILTPKSPMGFLITMDNVIVVYSGLRAAFQIYWIVRKSLYHEGADGPTTPTAAGDASS